MLCRKFYSCNEEPFDFLRLRSGRVAQGELKIFSKKF